MSGSRTHYMSRLGADLAQNGAQNGACKKYVEILYQVGGESM